MILPVTSIFIAIFALLLIPFTMAVGAYRMRSKISFLDGEDKVLVRRMRAHGNYVETVPMGLLVMAAAELSGASSTLLLIGGGALLVGRLAHYFTVFKMGSGPGRVAGMALTFLSIALLGVYTLLKTAGLL